MVAITLGSLTTVGWAVYKYWRIPFRLYKWHQAPETEPAVNQIWTEAGFSPKDQKWKVTGLDDHEITLIEDRDGEDLQEQELNWEDWALWVKKSRMYCSDRNDSIHDRYWGAGVDD